MKVQAPLYTGLFSGLAAALASTLLLAGVTHDLHQLMLPHLVLSGLVNGTAGLFLVPFSFLLLVCVGAIEAAVVLLAGMTGVLLHGMLNEVVARHWSEVCARTQKRICE